jgi:GTP cyclohydrolase I
LRITELKTPCRMPNDKLEKAQQHFRSILTLLGEDVEREGLLKTPERYTKFMWQFIQKEDFNFTVFESEGYDEMIIQKDIPFFSLCEHHTLPFFGTATVAYIPNDKIVGLSKLARTVQHYAHDLQNQERITSQVAERLEKELSPKGVAVTLSARHFCMEMRGVRTHDVHTVTTKLIGAFKEEPETRAEFMATVSKQ